jgi:hypothetical protein
MRYIILICLFTGLLSCSNRSTSVHDVDDFISKYKNEDFNGLKNIIIAERSADRSKIIYLIGKSEGNMPVYFVTFDRARQTVTHINNSILIQSHVPDYFTKDGIINAVNVFRKYDFYLLGVDSSKNVYINPFRANEPVYLLRLNTATGDSIVRKGYVYKLYKDNWYLNTSNAKLR